MGQIDGDWMDKCMVELEGVNWGKQFQLEKG